MMSNIFNSISHMLECIAGNSVVNKAILVCGSALASLFVPIIGLLVTCFACTAVDMVYGIKVARKFKQKITSHKNWRGTLGKILDEFTIIGLARLIEMTVLGFEHPFVLTSGATAIIALTELWSILENLNTLNPEGPWKSLGKFLKNKGEQYVGKIELHEHDDTDVAKEPQEDRR